MTRRTPPVGAWLKGAAPPDVGAREDFPDLATHEAVDMVARPRSRPRAPARVYPQWLDADRELRAVSLGLYVGNAGAVMHEGGWGAIIGLYEGMNTAHYPPCEVLLLWPFEDGTSIPPGLLDAARAVVENTDRPVLVHCQMGWSRSASVAFALLCVVNGLSEDEALRRVQIPEYAEHYPMPGTLASATVWVRANRRKPRTPR